MQVDKNDAKIETLGHRIAQPMITLVKFWIENAV